MSELPKTYTTSLERSIRCKIEDALEAWRSGETEDAISYSDGLVLELNDPNAVKDAARVIKKHVLREIEDYGYELTKREKWHVFDADDASTWPPKSDHRYWVYIGNGVGVRELAWMTITQGVESYAPSLSQAALRLRQLTRWSDRTMATALGTTHPTIRSLTLGQPVKRVPGLDDRLLSVLALADRLSIAVARSEKALDAVLNESTASGTSAFELLSAGEYGLAYVTALDALRPPRREGLMQGIFDTPSAAWQKVLQWQPIVPPSPPTSEDEK